jgi:hypothetical protein
MARRGSRAAFRNRAGGLNRTSCALTPTLEGRRLMSSSHTERIAQTAPSSQASAPFARSKPRIVVTQWEIHDQAWTDSTCHLLAKRGLQLARVVPPSRRNSGRVACPRWC